MSLRKLKLIEKYYKMSEEELDKKIDRRIIWCKHAPRKIPFGGCIGCKYEEEARKFVVDGICYYCPHFEPEDGWEEKIRRLKRNCIF